MFSCCMQKPPKDQDDDRKKKPTSPPAKNGERKPNPANGNRRSASPQKAAAPKATARQSSPTKQSSQAKQSSPTKQSSPAKQNSPVKESSPVKEVQKRQAPHKEVVEKRSVKENAETVSAASPTQVQVELLQSPPSAVEKEVEEIRELIDHARSKDDVRRAAQRLKDVITNVGDGNVSGKMSADLAGLVARLEAVTSKLEGVAASGGGGGGSAAGAATAPDVVAPYVLAYDDFTNGSLKEFLGACSSIGGEVNDMGGQVKALVAAQRDFLVKASKCKQPSQDELMALLKPMADKIQVIQETKDRSRASQYFNHLSTLSEAVPAFGWVAISPTPGPYAKEMADAGQFFANRVLKDWKEKDPAHGTFVKSWNRTMGELQTYIKANHTTGVAWNPKGVSASSLPAGGSTGAPAPPPPPPGGAGGPPPPPPPPPVELLTNTEVKEEKPATAALFQDINKGTDVTKGLKKVTDDMKTHKNTGLRLQTPVPYKSSPPTAPKPFKAFSTAKKEVKKPPRLELDGKKWLVEYQEGASSLLIENTQQKQTVYIYKCVNSTIQIKGKVNSIVLDNCKKCGVVFDDVISSVEFVNCQSVQGQVQGKLPTVTIDKTDGCMMYLSEASKMAQIITAKSSEMNILIPDSNGEYKEYAVVEQFRTQFDGKTLVTVPTDI